MLSSNVLLQRAGYRYNILSIVFSKNLSVLNSFYKYKVVISVCLFVCISDHNSETP